jgi:hypothetical protein
VSEIRLRRTHALWREAPGYLTVAARNGASVQIGGSAAAIWRLLPTTDDDTISIRELAARLSTDHQVPVATVEADVIDVLDALEALGCVIRRA